MNTSLLQNNSGVNHKRVKKKHPDHTSALARLKKVKGQLSGLEKMISDQRYCVDILVQFRAVSAGLNAIERSIFERHIANCVKGAIESKNKKDIEGKVKELMELIFKRL